MKNLNEYILDEELEQYLLEDLRMLMLCLQKTSLDDFYFETKQTSHIFESLSQLDNFDKLYQLFRKFFQKLPNNFEEKEYKINVGSAHTFCKEIKIILKKSNEGNSAKYIKHSEDFSIIYIELNTKDHQKNYYSTSLCGLILHELLHAYEDKCRISSGEDSIFSEFTNKYDAGFENIKRKDFVIKNLGVLNYFMNDKERRAYLSTIELDILEVIQRIKPKFSDMKSDKVLRKLKQTGTWKTYFNFGKFVMFIDKIDDNTLEKSYYFASKTAEEQSIDLKKRIAALKNNEELPQNFFIKSANEIRKECKIVWNKFQKKFNSVFAKVYNEVVKI